MNNKVIQEDIINIAEELRSVAEKLSGKTLLITGGAGFIGSHIVDAYIADGHDVVVVDNLSTGKKENLNPRAEFVLADITNLEEIKPHFAGIDCVFHLAALPRVQWSIENPIESLVEKTGATIYQAEVGIHFY